MPNQYYEDRYGYGHGREGGRMRERDDEAVLRREEWEREGGEERFEGARGEEDQEGGYAVGGDAGGAMEGVVYKGRGSMKYKERRRW